MSLLEALRCAQRLQGLAPQLRTETENALVLLAESNGSLRTQEISLSMAEPRSMWYHLKQTLPLPLAFAAGLLTGSCGLAALLHWIGVTVK